MTRQTMADEQAQSGEHWQLETTGAEAYERFLIPAMFARWAEHLVELAGLESGERVLDVACGTGIVARTAAERVGSNGSVTGIDLNEGMLAVARSVGAGTTPEIEWRQGDAGDLPVDDESFDVVFCQQGLQFFPDPVAALGEMRRVLSPNGRLAINVCRPISYVPVYTVLADALGRHVGEDAAAIMRSPFPKWELDDLRGLVREAGFGGAHMIIQIDSVRLPSASEFLWGEAASSPLAGTITGLNPAVRDALARDVTESLRPYTDDNGITFPMQTHMVVAHR